MIRGATIPLADAGPLRRAAQRTTLVRLALALALAAAAVAALVSANRLEVSESTLFAPGASGVLVLDLSSSIDAAPPAEIAGVMSRLVDSGGQAGLVLFSDVAYEALPASASTAELRPFLRFFRRPRQIVTEPAATLPQFRSRRALTPWSRSFRAGTRISNGLEVARSMVLDRSGPKEVMLVSDLDDSLFDVSALSTALDEYRRDAIRLRIVAINATGDSRAFFAKRVGRGAFIRRGEFQRPVEAASSRRASGTTPRTLVALTVLIAALLAVNELRCGRLAWRRA